MIFLSFYMYLMLDLDVDDGPLDRMEYISDVEHGYVPEYLPVGLVYHCLIRITDKTLVLTGGINKTEA